MRARVVRPADLTAADQERWQHHSAHPTLANPFLSFEFARAVGAARPDARVAVIDDDTAAGSESGFFAFQVDDDGVGLPIGATICDAQAVVSAPDLSWDAIELVTAAGLRSWSFDHLSVDQAPFVRHHRQRHVSPIVDLAGGLDPTLSAIRGQSKDVLAQVARRRRKLEREVGPVVFEWSSVDPEADLATLMRWKTEQYQRTDTWDRFAQPWITTVLRELAGTQSMACTGLLSTLRAGDRLVAAHFGLLGTERLCWWFPAYEPEVSRYSPGLILLVDLVTEAATRGLASIDLGRGEHPYKLRVATGSYEVAEGSVDVTRGAT